MGRDVCVMDDRSAAAGTNHCAVGWTFSGGNGTLHASSIDGQAAGLRLSQIDAVACAPCSAAGCRQLSSFALLVSFVLLLALDADCSG